MKTDENGTWKNFAPDFIAAYLGDPRFDKLTSFKTIII